MKTNHVLQASASRARRRGACALAALAGLMLFAASASARIVADPAPKICGSFSGPHWKYEGHSGTRYIAFTRNGGSCSFGLSWARRLVDKHPNGPAYAISGGPAGWQCANSVLRFGLCTRTVGGLAVAFLWGPKTK